MRKIYTISGFQEVDYTELFGYLHPTNSFFYMQEIPQVDAWGGDMFYWRNPNLQSDRVMVICASARDNVAETCQTDGTWPIGAFSNTDFDSDIIWADGGMVRWPLAASAN